MKINYYECYSYNLMKFLQIHSHTPVIITKHNTTDRTIWIYERSASLNELLSEYTRQGRAKKKIAI